MKKIYTYAYIHVHEYIYTYVYIFIYRYIYIYMVFVPIAVSHGGAAGRRIKQIHVFLVIVHPCVCRCQRLPKLGLPSALEGKSSAALFPTASMRMCNAPTFQGLNGVKIKVQLAHGQRRHLRPDCHCGGHGCPIFQNR